MKKTERDDQQRCYLIPFTSRLRALLLAELAQSRGLKCWLEEGNRYEVCICASEEDVEFVTKKARDADGILHLKQLEALALTIESIGERPSQELTTAISALKREVAPETAEGDEHRSMRLGRGSLESRN